MSIKLEDQSIFLEGLLAGYHIKGTRRLEFKDEKKQQRWDFFVRPDMEYMDSIIKSMISTKRSKMFYNEQRMKKLQTQMIVYIIIGVVLAILLNSLHYIVSLVALAIFGILCISRIGERSRLEKENRALQEEIDNILKNYEELKKQVPPLVSCQQLEDWLMEELKALEKEAIEELSLEGPFTKAEIKGLEDFQSIVLIEPGLIQSHRTPGYIKTQEHRKLVQLKDSFEPIYAVYYVQFLFVIENQIGVYGCFYDSIMQEKHGVVSDEYFYRHVTSVSTRTEEMRDTLSELMGDEAKAIENTIFKLTVASGDSISIALTDEKVVTRLQDTINAQRKMELEKTKGELEKKRREFELHSMNLKLMKKQEILEEYFDRSIKRIDNELKELKSKSKKYSIQIAEDNLPETRAQAALRTIRVCLREKQE